MNITTIVIQMTILLLIMIVGFVGAKKNIFNDEVNVYASNILLKIGIPRIQENKALWQFIKQSKNTRDFSHEMY